MIQCNKFLAVLVFVLLWSCIYAASTGTCCENGIESDVSDNNGAVASVWFYERWDNDILCDKGELRIESGRLNRFVIISKSSRVINIVALPYPSKGAFEMPKFGGDKLWYQATNLSLGQIYAEQISPTERWIFKIGELTIVSDTPFNPGKILSFSSKCKLSEDIETCGEFSIGNDATTWFKRNDECFLMLIPKGFYIEEVPPEWARRTWVKIPLPGDFGTFYGLAINAETVWTVTVDGEDYMASATEVDSYVDPMIFMKCGVS